jgi:hypothetical protein
VQDLFITIFVFLSAFAAFGQTDRGSITGAITDPSNAGVPGATIEVKSQITAAVYRGGASATGNYIVAELPPGEYALSVTATGFKKFVRENITVEVATDSRVDARLEIGPAAEAVLISESERLLKTERRAQKCRRGRISRQASCAHYRRDPGLRLHSKSAPSSESAGRHALLARFDSPREWPT